MENKRAALIDFQPREVHFFLITLFHHLISSLREALRSLSLSLPCGPPGLYGRGRVEPSIFPTLQLSWYFAKTSTIQAAREINRTKKYVTIRNFHFNPPPAQQINITKSLQLGNGTQPTPIHVNNYYARDRGSFHAAAKRYTTYTMYTSRRGAVNAFNEFPPFPRCLQQQQQQQHSRKEREKQKRRETRTKDAPRWNSNSHQAYRIGLIVRTYECKRLRR